MPLSRENARLAFEVVAMLVSEVMTPVETIGITTPAQEIAALLAKANISGVPVVDAKGA